MAHYRKLEVGGINYQFNIGKRYVAIKGPNGTEHVEKSVVGFEVHASAAVTPKMIADHIKGCKKDVSEYFPSCGCEGVEKTLVVNPYESEIREKTYYNYWCKSCYESVADDI